MVEDVAANHRTVGLLYAGQQRRDRHPINTATYSAHDGGRRRLGRCIEGDESGPGAEGAGGGDCGVEPHRARADEVPGAIRSAVAPATAQCEVLVARHPPAGAPREVDASPSCRGVGERPGHAFLFEKLR